MPQDQQPRTFVTGGSGLLLLHHGSGPQQGKEAAAGKNPVSHVGKLYNVIAGRIAARVSTESPDGQNVSCVLVSAIGRSVKDPQIVDIELARGQGGRAAPGIERVHEIVHSALDQTGALQEEVLSETLNLF